MERGDWEGYAVSSLPVVTLTGLPAGEVKGKAGSPGWVWIGGGRVGLANRPVEGRKKRREAVLTCAVKGVRFKFIVVLV